MHMRGRIQVTCGGGYMQQIPWPTCLHCPEENVAASQHPKTELPCIHQICDMLGKEKKRGKKKMYTPDL